MIFAEELSKTLKQLERKGVAILATAANNHVSARSMSIIVYEGKIVFQASKKSLKYQQIRENNKVAICQNNIQIEGIAQIINQPTLAVQRFAIPYKEKHPSSFIAYSSMQSSRVIEVTPTFITIWNYEAQEPYQVFIDLEKQTVHKEFYRHANDD